MMKFLFLFSIFTAVYAQQAGFQDLLTIDSFNVETPAIVVLTSLGASFPITDEKFTQGTDAQIIGTERDLQLSVLSGASNLVLTSDVSGGIFSCASPNAAAGESLVQWDGVDGSMNLVIDGLGSRDLTSGGLATAFRTSISTDFTTTVEFRIYSNGILCNTLQEVPGDGGTQVLADLIIPFTEFSGTCDFSDVGAIEINVNAAENVDVLLDLLTTYGPIPSSALILPTAESQWTIYFFVCISWDTSLTGTSGTVSLSLASGDDFETEWTFASDVPAANGNYEWVLYGILPGMATIHLETENGFTLESAPFLVSLPASGINNECITL